MLIYLDVGGEQPLIRQPGCYGIFAVDGPWAETEMILKQYAKSDLKDLKRIGYPFDGAAWIKRHPYKAGTSDANRQELPMGLSQSSALIPPEERVYLDELLKHPLFGALSIDWDEGIVWGDCSYPADQLILGLMGFRWILGSVYANFSYGPTTPLWNKRLFQHSIEKMGATPMEAFVVRSLLYWYSHDLMTEQKSVRSYTGVMTNMSINNFVKFMKGDVKFAQKPIVEQQGYERDYTYASRKTFYGKTRVLLNMVDIFAPDQESITGEAWLDGKLFTPEGRGVRPVLEEVNPVISKIISTARGKAV